jgi:hypothetical protein
VKASRREVRAGLRALIGLLLVLAVPGIACLCYYASDGLGAARLGWAPLVNVAWPVMLLSGVCLVAALLARPRRDWAVRTCIPAFGASGLLLLLVKAHLFGF